MMGLPLVTALIHAANSSTWMISPYLASMSLVYSWAPDSVYGNKTHPNSTMTRWARQRGIATARYPAGQASYWNWEDPSGAMGKSTLDPSFRPEDRVAADQWMSLDEYLDLCTEAGLRPLIGVNYNCHGNAWAPPLNESVARAVRQVEHVTKRGFWGALWYIGVPDPTLTLTLTCLELNPNPHGYTGNEDNSPQHADRWAAHARGMKAVDPSMKIFFNDNGLQPKVLKTFLGTVGSLVDGAEFHGKWPYGGTPKLPAGTYDEWLKEAVLRVGRTTSSADMGWLQVPLLERKTGQTWREKIAGLREAAKEAGRPDLLMANNEFGLGKPDRR